MNFGSQRFGRELLRAQPLSTPHPAPISSGPKSGSQASPDARQRTIRVFTIAAALVAVALLVTIPAHAQSRRPRRESNANRKARIAREIKDTYTHRWEVGGGGGFIRFRSGETLQKNSEIAFWTNTTYFLNPKLGITGEIRGGFGNAKVGNNTFGINFSPQISEYPFMGGVTYRLRATEKTAISAFALGGVAIGKFDGDTKGIPAASLGLWPSTSRPAFSIGANFDYNLYPNIAIRIAPSYLGTTFGSTIQNNVGFEMGVVYRFGRQK